MEIKEIYKELENLKNLKGLEFGSIGKSVLGLDIPYFFVGDKTKPCILIEGSIHAREYVNSFLIVKMIKYYLSQTLDFGIYFVPLCNPDGVGLCLEGKNFSLISTNKFNSLKLINEGSDNFSLWKANINAVDLNVNFDALWGRGKQNKKVLSSANFIGFKPNSEPEVNNLIAFANKILPSLVLCFHSKGEVIFYGFEVLNKVELMRDKYIAKQMQFVSGFKPIKTQKSVGGFSDWVSLFLRVPSFTVEVGKESKTHPIGLEDLDEIFNQTKHLPIVSFHALNKFEKTYK